MTRNQFKNTKTLQGKGWVLAPRDAIVRAMSCGPADLIDPVTGTRCSYYDAVAIQTKRENQQ